MRCSKCGAENPDRAKFCEECAAPFTRRCRSCGTENSPGAKFCIECAKPLESAGPSPHALDSTGPATKVSAESPDSSLDGERKTVTALFADIKGSMDLMEDLDPEEARAIVDPALKLMMDAAQHYGGYIVQSTGDGIFALFGAPIAHEDHAQRALFAALRLQDQLKRYSDRLRGKGRLPLQARVGVNTGEVVVRSLKTGDGHVETTPIGHAISLAARMQALAPVGSIAATGATRKLGEGYFTFKALGPAVVKGVSEPIEVFEVTGLGPLRTRLQRAASRGYTKFIGRHSEMEALGRAAEAARQGHGQIVAAVAEAGVGKSRLFYEFEVKNQSGWMVLEAASFSHGKATAYLPVIDLFHSYFAIEPDDDSRKRREKVIGKVLGLDRSLEDALPYVFGLLSLTEGDDPLAGMDAQIRRQRTLDHIKRLLLRESLNQPLMVVFEDLHWIDEETQAFLNLLADSIATAKLLLLVNYRPDYSHSWGSKTYYTQLRLDPLGKASASEMLSTRMGDSPELAPLKQLVLERTEGNPLFMEELVEALFEEGVLVRNGAVQVTRPLSQLKIPPTVQGILASRIDRLPREEKELLQTLAVIGSEFPLALVRHVVQVPGDRLDHLLNGLQTGEFIYEQPKAGDIGYTFKHALTHDVAYNLLLTERRKLLHERTAQAIEALYPEQLEDHYADLAHHYRSSTNIAKAIEYLRLAGEQAARRGAYAQALANVEPALKLIERLPEEDEGRLRAELRVHQMEGMAVSALYGLTSTERLHAFQRVCELGEQLGDESAEVRGRINVAGTYLSAGVDLSRGVQILRRCVDLVERSPSSELKPVVHLQLAGLLNVSGNPLQASSLLSNLMTHFDPEHPEAGVDYLPANPWVLTPTIFSLVQHVLGRPDDALKISNEALRRSRQLKHPFTLAFAIWNAARLRCQRRETGAVLEMAEAIIALAEKHGFRDWTAQGRSLRGWALVEVGQAEKGVAELEVNVPALPVMRLWTSAMVADAYLRADRTDRAINTLDEALAGVEPSEPQIDVAELHRLKGEAVLMRDSSATAEAEACFRKAIEIAKGQSARSWELRATTSLARLLRDTNRRAEARAILAEIYNWFTEGFDTADLKDAKALLDTLS